MVILILRTAVGQLSSRFSDCFARVFIGNRPASAGFVRLLWDGDGFYWCYVFGVIVRLSFRLDDHAGGVRFNREITECVDGFFILLVNRFLYVKD